MAPLENLTFNNYWLDSDTDSEVPALTDGETSYVDSESFYENDDSGDAHDDVNTVYGQYMYLLLNDDDDAEVSTEGFFRYQPRQQIGDEISRLFETSTSRCPLCHSNPQSLVADGRHLTTQRRHSGVQLPAAANSGKDGGSDVDDGDDDVYGFKIFTLFNSYQDDDVEVSTTDEGDGVVFQMPQLSCGSPGSTNAGTHNRVIIEEALTNELPPPQHYQLSCGPLGGITYAGTVLQ